MLGPRSAPRCSLAEAGLALAAVAVALLSACSDPGIDPPDAGVDADPDVEQPDAAEDGEAGITPDAPSDSAEDTSDGHPPDSDLVDAPYDVDAGDVEPDVPPDTADAPPDGPTGPNICGDGWRDPLVEECDDGLDPSSVEDRACTSTCLVVDRLASHDIDSRERRLGIGRHPVAGGLHGHAVVTVQMTGEAGDEAHVALTAFSPVGVRLGESSWGPVPLDADPVVAALPDGDYAVAYTAFDADGDGLGISLVRVSKDGTVVMHVGAANGTKLFSQRSADVLWTGNHLVVGWEDESTIPRRVCTRRFDAQLLPAGGETCTALAVPASRVSLATLQGQVVTSFRVDEEESSNYHVKLPGGGAFVTDPFEPAASGESLALVDLDDSTMLAVYADGQGQMIAAMFDGSGAALGEPTILGYPRGRPALAKTIDGVYLAWWEPAMAPDAGDSWDPAFDELWVQRLGWNGVELDTSAEPLSLPRYVWHRPGDQVLPALASVPYWPTGALVAAWTDLTATNFGMQAPHGDVVLELIPTPVLRIPMAY